MMRWFFIILGFPTIVFTLPVPAHAVSFSLSPSVGIVQRGCNFQVNIELDTQSSQTIGADAVVRYDQNRLATDVTRIGKGTLFADYLGITVDMQSGRISISGVALPTQPFFGKGVFATVAFTALPNAPTGTTAITFERESGKTTDSNVAASGSNTDILTSVANGTYTVASDAPCVNASSVQATIPPPQSIEAGVTLPTIVWGSLGGLLILLGAVGLLFL